MKPSRSEDAAGRDVQVSQHTVQLAHSPDVVLRNLADIADLGDPRLISAESYAQQLGDTIHLHLKSQKEDTFESTDSPPAERVYLEFEDGDERKPINFSTARKSAVFSTACLFTVLVSSSASAYALGAPSMTRDLNCTDFQATIGISVYALGGGIVPLFTAPFSEEFGRQPMYLCSSVGFLLFTIATALAKNIQTVLVARFFAGAFGSTGATVVGGTVADLFGANERGRAMSVFAAASIGSIGLGSVAAGWIEQNPHLEWRWIQWIHAIIAGIFALMVPIFMKETRSAVILIHLAKKMRKETRDQRIRARGEDERAALPALIYSSCTRALYLLCTEPVVLSFTIWLGFVWGILYVLIESIGPVFRTLHDFSSGEEGTVFVCITIGTLIGLCTNYFQERMYRQYSIAQGPEARLYAPMAAAILIPIGLFIYAWSTFPQVYWIALAIGIILIMWALFIVYLAACTYIADCYGPYASSAIAGQSFFRNMMGTLFPLFTAQMYARLTYHWANALFAFIAVAMIPIPYILFFYGPAIRARSKFASRVMHA